MKLFKTPKGETNMYYIIVGILIALGIVFCIRYYNDHRSDVVIHPPVVTVH